MAGDDLKQQRINLSLSQSKLAELTSIQQSRLSAFELQKIDLTKEEKEIIKVSLASLDIKKVQNLKKRRHRKRTSDGSTMSSRNRRGYSRTLRNEDYLNLLSKLEDRFLSNSNNLKAMSFFAGCGGLCYGIKAAGFDIVAVNELEEAYKEIYKENFSNFEFLPNDITKIKDSDIRKILQKHNNIDLMIGGPPCQGFSLAGKRDVHDSRNTLFQYYLHIASIVKPKVILMENVRLLTSMKDPNGEYVSKRVLDAFKDIGYNCAFFTINSKNYGVPQHRERVIFIGLRYDLDTPPSIPLPGYGSDLNKTPCFTFGVAVSDLKFLESGEWCPFDSYHKAVSHPEHVIKWLLDVPEGKSAHENLNESLRPPSGYNTTYKRLVWDAPAGTVTTNYSMISGCRNVHPVATRALTTREALRLQSFPDSFRLTGKKGDVSTTIGNAVPPLLAYFLGKHIKESYIL